MIALQALLPRWMGAFPCAYVAGVPVIRTFRLRKRPFWGKGLQPGLEEGNWAEIRKRVRGGSEYAIEGFGIEDGSIIEGFLLNGLYCGGHAGRI